MISRAKYSNWNFAWMNWELASLHAEVNLERYLKMEFATQLTGWVSVFTSSSSSSLGKVDIPVYPRIVFMETKHFVCGNQAFCLWKPSILFAVTKHFVVTRCFSKPISHKLSLKYISHIGKTRHKKRILTYCETQHKLFLPYWWNSA